VELDGLGTGLDFVQVERATWSVIRNPLGRAG